MLYLDCALGLVFLVVLFFIRPESEKKRFFVEFCGEGL
jgi:hypothetical protein